MFSLIPFNLTNGVKRNDDFQDFYNMIDGFFNDNWSPTRSMQSTNFKVDVRENDKEYLIDADLPGFSKDEIKLDLVNNQLIISATKQEQNEEENERYVHRERRCQSVQRGVYLKNISRENVSAKYENGVLQIVVPKIEDIESKTQILID